MNKILFPSLLFFAIIFNGCTSSEPFKVYQPEKNTELNTYFINGIPIGVLVDDSIILMTIIEPISIAGDGYMRLWLLYGNKMNTDYLLAPMDFATMTISGKDYYSSNIKPESPSKILADIEDEKIKASISTTIGGALQTLSTQNTKVYDEYKKEKLSIGDKDIKNELILQKTREQLGNIVYYYDIFQESVNQGLLRRNTIFPFRSVNGYIYFPLTDFDGRRAITFVRDVGQRLDKITFGFKTPVGNKTIEFKTIKGE